MTLLMGCKFHMNLNFKLLPITYSSSFINFSSLLHCHINTAYRCINTIIIWKPHVNIQPNFWVLLGVNFRNQKIFFPDFPLQPADAPLFKFNYIPSKVRAFLLSRDFVTAAAENLREGAILMEGKRNLITACLLLLRDVRGNCYIWLIFLAKFFNCFVI